MDWTLEKFTAIVQEVQAERAAREKSMKENPPIKKSKPIKKSPQIKKDPPIKKSVIKVKTPISNERMFAMFYFLKFSVLINGIHQNFDLTTPNIDSMLFTMFQCLRSETDSVTIKTNPDSVKKDDEVRFEVVKGEIICTTPNDQEKFICGTLKRIGRHS